MLRFPRRRLGEINLPADAGLYDPKQRQIPLTEDQP